MALLRALLVLCLPLTATASGDDCESAHRALGLTTMGAVFMVMGVVYLAHWPDPDIRKATWATINSTLSIFCAVITFNNVNELLSVAGIPGSDLAVNRLHVIGWYLCLCASLAKCAGVGTGLSRRKEVLSSPQVLARRRAQMKCCLFLAHTTGFAGIYGWGLRMNMSWYSESPLHCAFLIPSAIVWYACLIVVAGLSRQAVLSAALEKEGAIDGLLSLGSEHLQDGENDFFGLFVSILAVSTLRFRLGGRLPNAEGSEGEAVYHHDRHQVLQMYGAALACFVVACAVLRLRAHFPAPRGRWVQRQCARALERFAGLTVNLASFCFAWCFMYATQWFLAPFFVGEELALGIALALVLTLCSSCAIKLLDDIADATELTGEDAVCRKLMEAMAVLIGFAWERCFDDALAGVARGGAVWLKPLLGVLTVLVILPVWLWYIAPMVTASGYLLGLHPGSLERRFAKLQGRHRKQAMRQAEGMLEALWAGDEELARELLKAFCVGKRLESYVPPPVLQPESFPTTPTKAQRLPASWSPGTWTPSAGQAPPSAWPSFADELAQAAGVPVPGDAFV